VLDKSGAPADLRGWTGAIEVTPENGTARTYKLEPATPGKEHSKANSENAEERYSDNSNKDRNAEEPSQKGKSFHQQADGQSADKKDRMLCGEAQKMDDGWVELVVVWPNMAKEKGMAHDGFKHDHGMSYFRAPVDLASIRDTKTNSVNFNAKVAFTTPNGDTKYAKGFTYPRGMVDGAVGHLLDKEFKDTSKLDHEQASRLADKVQWMVGALPSLSFAKDGDRQDYEKAKQDCLASCKRMKESTGKNIGDVADECKSALKELRSQAHDAQGALPAE
jgi:hypothetical protein